MDPSIKTNHPSTLSTLGTMSSDSSEDSELGFGDFDASELFASITSTEVVESLSMDNEVSKVLNPSTKPTADKADKIAKQKLDLPETTATSRANQNPRIRKANQADIDHAKSNRANHINAILTKDDEGHFIEFSHKSSQELEQENPESFLLFFDHRSHNFFAKDDSIDLSQVRLKLAPGANDSLKQIFKEIDHSKINFILIDQKSWAEVKDHNPHETGEHIENESVEPGEQEMRALKEASINTKIKKNKKRKALEPIDQEKKIKRTLIRKNTVLNEGIEGTHQEEKDKKAEEKTKAEYEKQDKRVEVAKEKTTQQLRSKEIVDGLIKNAEEK